MYHVVNTYIHLMQQNQGHVIDGNTHHMKRHDIYVNLSYIKMSVFWLKKTNVDTMVICQSRYSKQNLSFVSIATG